MKRLTWLAMVLVAACGQPGGDGRSAARTNGANAPGDSSAAASATGDNTPDARNGAGDAPGRVVILGTSLTAGLGLDPERAYPALLQAKADSAGYRVQIVNAGLSGETSAGALRRAGWVLEQPARLVVLEVGANDGLRGVNPDSTYENLVKLIEAVKSQRPDADIALVQMEAPPNFGRAYTSRFHDVYGRAAASTGVVLWPFLLEDVAGVAALNQADGIHPNAEGARRVASTLWPALDAMLRP
jgi:acyl-CoA thioesterase I